MEASDSKQAWVNAWLFITKRKKPQEPVPAQSLFLWCRARKQPPFASLLHRYFAPSRYFSFINWEVCLTSLFPFFRPWTWTCAAGELLQGSRQAVPQSLSGEVRNSLKCYMGLAEIFLLTVVECWTCSEGILQNSCPGSVLACAVLRLLCWSLELSVCTKTSL